MNRLHSPCLVLVVFAWNEEEVEKNVEKIITWDKIFSEFVNSTHLAVGPFQFFITGNEGDIFGGPYWYHADSIKECLDWRTMRPGATKTVTVLLDILLNKNTKEQISILKRFALVFCSSFWFSFIFQDARDLLKDKDPDKLDHDLMRDPRAFLSGLPGLTGLQGLEAFHRHRDLLSSPQNLLSAATAGLRNGPLLPPTSLSMGPFGMSPLPARPPSQPATPSSQSSSPIQQTFGSNQQNWSFEEQFKQVCEPPHTLSLTLITQNPRFDCFLTPPDDGGGDYWLYIN